MKKTSLYISIIALFVFLTAQNAFAYTFVESSWASTTHVLTHSIGPSGNLYDGSYPDTSKLCGAGSGFNSPLGLGWLSGSDSYCSFANNSSKYFWYTDGTYYVQQQWGQDFTPPPPDTSTRIISLLPSSNATIIPFVSTSTDRSADFDVDLLTYYNNTSTSSIILISTYLKNNNIPSYNYSKSQLSDFGSGEATTSYNIAHNVPFGNYDLTITLLGDNLSIISATTSSNITFGSSTNAITFADVYGASSSDMFDIGQIATSSICSITNLTGCFKNALVWAFYPSQSSLEAYTSFVSLIQTKAPFGYFSAIKTAISGISTSSTSTFNITIPAHLKAYIFNPFDVGIASILWIYFIFMFYKRLKHIQI